MNLFQLSNFRNLFIFVIVFISISFSYLIHIQINNQNPILQNENNILFLILFLLIGFLMKNIISSNPQSQISMRFVGFLFVLFILLYVSNYIIDWFFTEKKIKTSKKDKVDLDDKIRNEWKKFITLLLLTLSLTFFSLLILPYLIPNIFSITHSIQQVLQSDLYYFIGFFFLFFIYRYLFGIFYTRNAKSSLFLPTLLGIPVLLSIFLFVVYVGSKLKIIHWKNYMTTMIVLMILTSLFFYIWLYIFMDSVSDLCKAKKTKEEIKYENSWIGRYLSTFLLIGIVGMLWIIDAKRWSRMECIFYIIVSVLLFTSFSTLSTKYPNSSLLSMWLFIEWVLVTYHNWINVKGSFHCIFSMDD